MRIDIIAGARPNFVKIASIIHAIQSTDNLVDYRLIHTGQHYTNTLSDLFFQELNIPEPQYNLKVGSGSQAAQTAEIMLSYEKLLKNKLPDVCLVVGDVTSSMACAITAKKLKIKIAHVEAGLRSYDWNMPEEVNRVLIDSIADYFFTTTQEAANLLLEIGKKKEDVFFVGNTMIDTLIKFKSEFNKPEIWSIAKLEQAKYIILTLHRPSNVDDINKLEKIINEIIEHSRGLPIIFPAHPRISKHLKELDLDAPNLFVIEALSYLKFNYLVSKAKVVITDSGGITEETSFLNIPCMTIRNSTERPETLHIGTNELIGTDPAAIEPALNKLFAGKWKKGKIPELWDGKAGERIVKIIKDTLKTRN